jgi:hypothetical protein
MKNAGKNASAHDFRHSFYRPSHNSLYFSHSWKAEIQTERKVNRAA